MPAARFTHADSASTLAFAPDGRSLVGGVTRDNFNRGTIGAIAHWEGGSYRVLSVQPAGRPDPKRDPWRKLLLTSTGLPAVAFVRGGKALANTDGTAVSIRTANGDGQVVEVEQAPLKGDAVLSGLAAPADGRLLAAGENWRPAGGTEPMDAPSRVFVWDTETGKVVVTLAGHGDGVAAVAFAPDGTLLASVDYSGWVRLWDVAGRRELAAFRGHPGPAYTVAVSPDGKTVATGGDDGAVRLWDVATITGAAGGK